MGGCLSLRKKLTIDWFIDLLTGWLIHLLICNGLNSLVNILTAEITWMVTKSTANRRSLSSFVAHQAPELAWRFSRPFSLKCSDNCEDDWIWLSEMFPDSIPKGGSTRSDNGKKNVNACYVMKKGITLIPLSFPWLDYITRNLRSNSHWNHSKQHCMKVLLGNFFLNRFTFGFDKQIKEHAHPVKNVLDS